MPGSRSGMTVRGGAEGSNENASGGVYMSSRNLLAAFRWFLDEPQMRAWLDDDGRIMVLATHNTDVGDGWEREAYGEWYFETFSTKSYMVGVNVVVYAMTH